MYSSAYYAWLIGRRRVARAKLKGIRTGNLCLVTRGFGGAARPRADNAAPFFTMKSMKHMK